MNCICINILRLGMSFHVVLELVVEREFLGTNITGEFSLQAVNAGPMVEKVILLDKLLVTNCARELALVTVG